jgi:putative transposase
MRPPTTKKRRRPRAAVNKVTASYRIADALWAVLQPLLPVHVNGHRFGGGRPRVADRRCADTIFYVLRTGCQGGVGRHRLVSAFHRA